MNLSRQSPAPTRYAGIGLVVALHLAGIYALSAGLITPTARPKDVTTLVPVKDVDSTPPKPQDPIKAQQPTLTPPVIHPPIIMDTWDVAPAAPTASPGVDTVPAVPGGAGLATGGSGTAATVIPAVPATTGISAPGAVCSVMPRPEVPAVNWTGDAVLQVVATVRGGRVVQTDFRVTQGALDGKTRRALQRSVDTALAGYQCQGDAMFQQDFAFRID